MVDDFGMQGAICSAALRLASMNLVHAITCMVGGAAWSAWHPLLRRLDPRRVDLGLHLDFTDRPLTMPRKDLKRLIAASLLRSLDEAAVDTEIAAQLDAFEQAVGRGPDFVDGHQHVHQLPVIRDRLLGELRTRYADDLPWIRSTRSAGILARSVPSGWRDRIKPWLVQTLGAAALASSAREMSFPQNGRLLGVYDFSGNEDAYLHRLQDWLDASRDGDLLMCHPGLGRTEDDLLNITRQREYSALASPRFADMLCAHDIALEPMSRILARRPRSMV